MLKSIYCIGHPLKNLILDIETPNNGGLHPLYEEVTPLRGIF